VRLAEEISRNVGNELRLGRIIDEWPNTSGNSLAVAPKAPATRRRAWLEYGKLVAMDNVDVAKGKATVTEKRRSRAHDMADCGNDRAINEYPRPRPLRV